MSLLACDGGDSAVSPTAPPPPPTPAVTSVSVAPAATVMITGATLPLSAETRSATGEVLAGRQVTWSSSSPTVAGASSVGVVTAVSTGGPVTITASSEGVSGAATITIVAGVVTGIRNIGEFLERCPANDPAYNTIRQDFEIRVDGQLATEPTGCNEPVSTLAVANVTDELLARQVFRTVYYLAMGTAGKLPWTTRNLYDWMKSNVSGVNIKTAPGQLYCCDVLNGKRYFSLSRQSAEVRDFNRSWPGLAGLLVYYAHEIRHVDAGAPGHVTGCAAFPLATDPPGCDTSYDVSNLGSYGVQHWLAVGLVTGYLHVGMGCVPPATRTAQLNWMMTIVENARSRFVTNVPPTVVPAILYGGPCIAS